MIHATIEYEVRFLGAGAVLPASGFGSGGVDRGVARTLRADGRRVPYVPGSHVRGIVRERVEHLARLVLGEDAVRTPVHREEPSMNPDLGDPVARLFVTADRPGMVVFRDLLPVEGNGTTRVARRARVSIDRRTGTQREKRLFDHETWYSGSLRGTVRAWFDREESADLDLALLVGGLRLVDGIGANRSAGLGRCEVLIREVTRGGKPVDWRQLLERELGRTPE